ncbi:fimbria/pilus outer membrane usher protein [Providencia vermicola]|uniref:fimbria/pilus outer membrane usher protein n=1 Tax=Providencia vermicola TaxID=333965 RepID=UPI0034E68128
MKQRELINKYSNTLSVTCFVTACMVPTFYAWSEEDTTYEFNSGFIIGSKEEVDLARFNSSGISPGKYSVDVYTNNNWKGRYDLNFEEQKDGRLAVCYTPAMLSDFGINTEKLNPTLNEDSDSCLPLKDWNNEKDVVDIFHASTLRLDISVPQIYEQRISRGYVSPQFWETGIPALNVSYMANYYDNHTSGSQGTDNASAYLGLNAGLSFDGWLFKHIGNLNWQRHDGTNWNSNQTYLQKPIAGLKSKATAGQFYTDGDLFDSISLRGAKLATDDNMYPDGMSTYAPEIRGIAQSNALVTVRQNGSIIYQTTVSPGPFSLTDVYPSGYGNDLVVTVKEADGNETTFSVPYSSLAQLLRPGFTRYQVASGKADADGLRNRPFIMQGTIQHGLNNTFTLYGGVTAFDDYQAYLVGTGINTGFGAVAVDLTQSRTAFKYRTENGQSYRLTFSRLFTQTDTNLVLAAYRYSTKDYYNINNALYAIDNDKRGVENTLGREKNGFSYTINQNLPEGFGGVYFTGRISNYWDKSGTEEQYQLSYNNNYNRLSYGIALMRVYADNTNNNKKDDRISLNLSYPLYFGESQSATLTSNTVFNNEKFGSTQIGASGAFDKENNWTYGVNTSVANGGEKNIGLNTGYRTSLVNTNANYSQGQGYRQFGLGANGSMIVHSGGVTLTPNSSTTLALIEAKGAEGASIMGAPGTRVDSNGYAIAPYVRAYRINNVEIDPKGSPEDIVFENTSSQVVPYEGSVVKVKFGTKVEKNIAFNVVRPGNKSLPFGANVTDKNGESIGIVGQGGTVFISSETAKEAFIKWDNGQCSFSLEAGNSKESLCQ